MAQVPFVESNQASRCDLYAIRAKVDNMLATALENMRRSDMVPMYHNGNENIMYEADEALLIRAKTLVYAASKQRKIQQAIHHIMCEM